MYFRKYFSGVNENGTDRFVFNFPNNTNLSIYKNQTDTVAGAIAQTCVEAGINAEYDSSTCILTIDGFKMFLLYSSQYMYYCGSIYREFTPISSSSSSNMASYQPFNTDYKTYKFYVVLKGDIDGILNIYITTYQSDMIGSENYGFAIGKAKSILFGNIPVRTLNVIGGNNYNIIYYYKPSGFGSPDGETNVLYSEIKAFNSTSLTRPLTSNSTLMESGNKIPLINSFTWDGNLLWDNVYMAISSYFYTGFYNIDNMIYCAVNDMQVTKCSS